MRSKGPSTRRGETVRQGTNRRAVADPGFSGFGALRLVGDQIQTDSTGDHSRGA